MSVFELALSLLLDPPPLPAIPLPNEVLPKVLVIPLLVVAILQSQPPLLRLEGHEVILESLLFSVGQPPSMQLPKVTNSQFMS